MNSALLTFLIYMVAVFALAAVSNHLLKSKSFLSEYFLGSRSLGVWAFALTFAATSSSGGSFTGFPSKIYTYGWVLAVWIASYMVVPICSMGLLGKRLNQVARISGAITVPDVIRDRFRSTTMALIAVCLIVFFMSFNLVAQFRAGSLILSKLLSGVTAYESATTALGGFTSQFAFLGNDPAYLLCLMSFGIAVVVYTTYGGFRAVVWTDVMQGVVMVLGVLILLPLALFAVGGLPSATKIMAEMTPPRYAIASVQMENSAGEPQVIGRDHWLLLDERDQVTRAFRVATPFTIPADVKSIDGVELLELTAEHDLRKIVPGNGESPGTEYSIRTDLKIVDVTGPTDYIGSATLTADSKRELQRGDTVPIVTDTGNTLQLELLENATVTAESSTSVAVRRRDSDRRSIDGITVLSASVNPASYRFGDGQAGVYVTGPGPSRSSMNGFLPLSLAFSFFFMWAIAGAGQPSNMVRLMAFRDSRTLRRSICTVAIYYTMIYFPLVVIFCCARVLIPGMEVEPDRIMPEVAVFLTERAGVAWLAGLLVAAPFAAVMSTVDSFLLMISSAIVRDIYHRNINPQASETTLKRLSYLCTLLIGVGAMIGAVNPPRFLQDIIVYVSSGLAACFLAPMVYGLYWRRINTFGALAAMLGGFAAHLTMYGLGTILNGSFYRPYLLFSFDPVIVGLAASFLTGYVVCRITPPPPADLVSKYFEKH